MKTFNESKNKKTRKRNRRLYRLFSLSSALAFILQLIPFGLPVPIQAVTSLVERAPYPANNILAPIVQEIMAPVDALIGPVPLAHAALVPGGFITITKNYSATVYQNWDTGNNQVSIEIPYQININNATGGPVAAMDLLITPTLPSGVPNWDGSNGSTIGGGIWWYQGGNGTQIRFWNVSGPLAIGSSYVGQYQLELFQPVRDGTVVTDTQTLFLYNGNPYFDTHTYTTTIRAPDFSLSESWASPSNAICPGQRLTYTIGISNPGGADATMPFTVTGIITNPLSIYPSTLSADATTAGQVITWSISGVALYADGANTLTRTFAVSVPATLPNGSYLTNTYTITSPGIVLNQSSWSSSGSLIGTVASFTPVSATIFSGQSVAFNNTSLGATGYQWNFGDGSPITTAANPSHTFSNTGSAPISYTVTLTATGDCAGIYTATGTVIVNPLPRVQFETSNFAVNENTGPAIITATMNIAPIVTATVDYATIAGGTATAGSDYTTVAPSTLTFAPGVTSMTFAVPITNDLIDEPDETVWLLLSNPVSATITGTNPVTLTIVDDDVPQVAFSSAAYNVNEDAGSATITATLNITSWQTIWVDYATSDGTATTGSDYLASPSTLTFLPGSTQETFLVFILDDVFNELDETVILSLTNPINTIITGTNPATLTILDNDAVTATFSSATYSADEDVGATTITVTLNTTSTQLVTVTYTTTDGTATAPADYAIANGTLAFAPGSNTETFNVFIVDDSFNELDETVDLTLISTSPNANLGTPSAATLTILDNDLVTATFSSATYSTDEGAGSATITVALNITSTQPVTVAYTSADGTATAPADYGAVGGTLTFVPSDDIETFTVSIADDGFNEPDETVNLTLTGTSSNANLGNPSAATLTILDNDTVTATFSSAIYNADEGVGSTIITVSLNITSTQPVTVAYTSTDGTATAPADYGAASGTLTFVPSDDTETFTVSIVDDLFNELDETVGLTLIAASPNANLGNPSAATLTILDNDAVTVTFSSATYNEDEGAGSATISVVLNITSTQPVTVAYTSADGTAIAPADYGAVGGTLTLVPGDNTETFTVSIVDDLFNELDETVGLTLTATSPNANLGIPSAATLTILDNDLVTATFSSATYNVDEDAGSATIAVLLNITSTQPVTVAYTSTDGTATAPADYGAANGTLTFLPGSDTETFNVSIVDDLFNELDETVDLTLTATSPNANLGTLSAATLTILDNDIVTATFSSATYNADEGVGAATITVSLNITSAQPVVVVYASADGTATAPADYTTANGTLTFLPGSNSETFNVPIVDDLFNEPDETLDLALTATSPNANLGTPSAAILTILDNDMVTATFSSTTYSTDEGAGSTAITVVLNVTSTQPVIVAYTTNDGTAIAPADYAAVNNALTFSPGSNSETFNVPIVDDLFNELNETVNLALTATSPNANLGTPSAATLTILDNDLVTATFSSMTFNASEGAGSATITVSLNITSTQPVTVAYTTGDGTATAPADYAVTNGTLTFAPGTNSETFTVSIVDDNFNELDETVALTLTATSPNAGLGTPSAATLTIVDNDIVAVAFDSVTYNMDEGAGSATIAVVLNITSTQPVTAAYTSGDGTAIASDDYGAVGGTLTFVPGDDTETFNVPIIDDLFNELDETVALTLTATSPNANLGIPPTATLTILDNDAVTATFSSPTYSVDEGVGLAFVTITLNTTSTQWITVSYTSGDGTAIAPGDYATSSGTRTFLPGSDTQTFSVIIVDDAIDELDETMALTLAATSPNANLGIPSAATLTILDNDVVSVTFSSPAYNVDEGAGSAAITVTLNVTSTQPVTVAYTTGNGTAIAPADYTTANGTLTFAPGSNTETFNVPIVDDGLDEPAETVNLTLTATSPNANLGTPSTATLTILDNDAPTVQFDSAAYVVNEGAGSATITVTLNGLSWQPVSVNYTTGDGTALASSDYGATNGTLIFAPGQTALTFTVTITDDALLEMAETVALTLSSPVSATLGAPAAATLTILDNDPQPNVVFSSATYSVDEPSGPAIITVTLSAVSGVTTTVDYVTGDGTALAGSDYASAGGTLTFAPFLTETTFTVPITDDLLFEPSETVALTLSNPVSATLGAPSTATLTIVDDEAPQVQFSSATYSVNENGGPATITVTLNVLPSITATVDYATGDGTALAGSDYGTANGTLTFVPGQTVLTFTVTIMDDAFFELNETVVLTLSNPVSATLGTPAVAILTILNDDPVPDVTFSNGSYSVDEDGGPATITVTLSAASTITAAVDYTTGDGTALAGSDYSPASSTLVFAPGQTTLTFTVAITDDTLSELDETVALTLSNPVSATLGAPAVATLTIVDDETLRVQFSSGSYSVAEAGDPAVVTITLSAAVSFTARIDYSTGDGTALAGSDYGPTSGTLTFVPGQTVRTFTVAITNDTLFELDETVVLTLSNPVSTTLGTPMTATLTILDDDLPPDVAFSSGTYSVDEGGGMAVISVTLSVASGAPASVDYATGSGTALAGSDYGTSSGTLLFAPGQTTLTFTVAITDDALFELNETVALTLSNPASVTLGAPTTTTLTILDNDPQPGVAFSSGSYSVTENSGPAIITVTLSAASGVVTTIDYVTGNGTATAGIDYGTANGTLTFAPGQTALAFTVTITDDAFFELDETVALTLSNPVSTTLGTPTTATLTILDDDPLPGIAFSSGSYSVTENGGPAIVTVTLSAASSLTATTDYNTSGGTATAGSDYGTTSGTLTFAPGQTVLTFAVTITDDAIFELDETVGLALSNPISVTLGVPNPATLTILNDEPPPDVAFSSGNFDVNETDGLAVISVTLSWASGVTATVDYATSDGTATAGSDYTGVSGTLTLVPGITNTSFTVPITDDLLYDPGETVTLTLSGPVNAALGTPNPATLIIVNDDALIVGVDLSPPTAAQRRAVGTTATYPLTLTNTGNAFDSFDLTWSIAGELWTTVVAPMLTPIVPPGGTAPVTVAVSIPLTATTDQQSFASVTATSVLSTSFSDSSVLTTTACVPAVITSLISNSPVKIGQVMYFTATVTGSMPITYTWDFGDGTPPVTGVGLTTISKLYAMFDVYTVTLTVYNNCDPDIQTLTVEAEPFLAYLPIVLRQHPIPFCAPQLVTEIPTGPMPHGVTLDTANDRAFVAHANGVTVIDTVNLVATAEISSPVAAHGIAYDPDHNYIWVTYMDTDQVTVYDGSTFGVIGNISSNDGPHSVAYNPTNNQVYISNYWGGFVNAYDAQSFAYLDTLTGVSEPAHIAVNSVSNKIYVANHRSNAGVTVIDGATNNHRTILTALLDPYAVTVDTTRNLVYAAAIAEGRITIIDGATDQQIGSMKIRRGNGDTVPLRVISINPNVGAEGHLFLTTSSEDGGQNQFLLIPNGWPTLGTPVPLDIASYPLDGIALDPDTNQVWVTSAGSGLVNVIQDGLPVCNTPFDLNPSDGRTDTLHIEVSTP